MTLFRSPGAPPEYRYGIARIYRDEKLHGKLPSKKQPWRNVVFAKLRNTEMARDNRFKLVLRNEGKGPNELYDERSDAREKTNVYNDPRYVTTRDGLTKELAAWRTKYSS